MLVALLGYLIERLNALDQTANITINGANNLCGYL